MSSNSICDCTTPDCSLAAIDTVLTRNNLFLFLSQVCARVARAQERCGSLGRRQPQLYADPHRPSHAAGHCKSHSANCWSVGPAQHADSNKPNTVVVSPNHGDTAPNAGSVAN